MKPVEGETGYYDCDALYESSDVYKICCDDFSIKEFKGISSSESVPEERLDCNGDEAVLIKGPCLEKSKFCEWKGEECVENPCGKQENSTKCLENEFNGEQCKWLSHEKYSYCSSASSLTVGLSSLLVLYSTFNY